ncbi:PD40 domain-containing protein [candidate division WOR-3 bacterium]|nr:PD40 domain-containing protein [candidate division WOR-3 bacterium]
MSKRSRIFVVCGLVVALAAITISATTNNIGHGKKQRKSKDKTAQLEKKKLMKGKRGQGRISSARVTNKVGEKNPYVTVRRLTTNEDADGFPSWSPDGQWIVYQADDDSYYNYGIWKINVNGTGLTPVALPDTTVYTGMCFNRPSWSPDGSKIAYHSRGDTTHGGVRHYNSIFIINPDGSGRQRVSLDTTGCCGLSIPGWSPDGKRIVCKNDSLDELIVVNVDAGTETNINALTTDSIYIGTRMTFPKFSPDGSKILFKSDAGDTDADGHICVIDTSGTNYTIIDTLSQTRKGADWSPDGNQIVYTNDKEENGYSNIWIANVDGSGGTPILEDENNCLQEVAWQPSGAKANGKWIVYAPTVSGDYDYKNIWVVSTDGLYTGCLVNQTTTEYWHVCPTWSPQGDKIVFASDWYTQDDYYDIFVVDLDTDDNDVDGLLNWEEFAAYGTAPEDRDTDKGDENDGSEIANGRDPTDPSDDVGAAPPYTLDHSPVPTATNVSPRTKISLRVKDDGAGVDKNSIVMTIEGDTVTPNITKGYEHMIVYKPQIPFPYNDSIDITIDAKDRALTPNSMHYTYYFTTIDAPDIACDINNLVVALDSNVIFDTTFSISNASGVRDTLFFAIAEAGKSAEDRKDLNWLSVNPDKGFIVPDNDETITISFNTTGISAGEVLTGYLVVVNNDPDEPAVVIPINLSVGVEEAESRVPVKFNLLQNAPNPMHDITNIEFQVPRTTQVSLKIYDTSGRLVRTLVNESKTAGYYTVIWDRKNSSGKSVASGVYLYEMKAGNYKSYKKIIVQ